MYEKPNEQTPIEQDMVDLLAIARATYWLGSDAFDDDRDEALPPRLDGLEEVVGDLMQALDRVLSLASSADLRPGRDEMIAALERQLARLREWDGVES